MAIGMEPRRRRPVQGAALSLAGVWGIILAVFWAVGNWEDEGPRCLGGCAASLLQYYQTVYVASSVVVALGIVAIVLGVWLLIRRP